MSKSGGNVITTPCYHAGYTGSWSDDSSYTLSGTGNY